MLFRCTKLYSTTLYPVLLSSTMPSAKFSADTGTRLAILFYNFISLKIDRAVLCAAGSVGKLEALLVNDIVLDTSLRMGVANLQSALPKSMSDTTIVPTDDGALYRI